MYIVSFQKKPLKIEFSHLERVYNMERGNPTKMAHKLTDKVLHPSNLERVNVKLTAAATHESTTAALRQFAQLQPSLRDFNDTAEFLELVRRWFNICNVKSPNMAKRLNDDNRVPLRTNCEKSEVSLQFLEDFGRFMRDWLESEISPTEKLSKDTSMALFYTCRGLAGLTRHLLKTHEDVQYVLLGKVQSDAIEGHFGHLRRLAGSNYWASVRQFMEGETVIRISSLIWWSGVKVSDIPARMSQSQEVKSQADSRAVQVLKEVASRAEGADEEELPDSAKAALGHISGYLAHAATKNEKCEACSNYLVARDKTSIKVEMKSGEDENTDIMHSFSKILDRGRLLVPSPVTIEVTLFVLNIWKDITQDPESKKVLFDCSQPREVFADVVQEVGKLSPKISDLQCGNGHRFMGRLRRMSRALFHLFAGNMVRDINSTIHGKRTSHGAGRTKADDKRRKLSGIKKA